MGNQLNFMTAMLSSARARRRNAMILDNHPLVQLQKEVAGVGQPLPGRPQAVVPASPVGTVYPVGVGVGGLAPNNMNELNGMSLDQISALSEWANDTFGILPGDNIGEQCDKLRHHYQG